MLAHSIKIALLLGVTAMPALAQNADHIAKVENGQSCAECNLFQADLTYQDAEKIDLSGARLRQSSLALTTFDDVNFSRANLSVSNLFGARFNRNDFRQANLQNVVAVGAYFGASNLNGADLTGANLSGADLSLAKGLTQAQLNQACGDSSTRLPKGKTIPSCV